MQNGTDVSVTGSTSQQAMSQTSAALPPNSATSSQHQAGSNAQQSNATNVAAAAPSSSATTITDPQADPPPAIQIPVETGTSFFPQYGGVKSEALVTAATNTRPERRVELRLFDIKVHGNGSFGWVYVCKAESGERLAIKRVLQDNRYKNRELQIMRRLSHQNVVKLYYFFFQSSPDSKDKLYLNLVLEYMPQTIYRLTRHFTRQMQHIPMLYVKLYSYQLFRALAYIHSIGVCHRDIKPQNLLIDPESAVLKLCDFGSAKYLVPGEPNVAYICSRYYRAPELIFGATDYTVSIDVWSAGTVVAELMLGQPLFPGDSGVDQLVEIIKVLGTPTREEINKMNPNYTTFRFPLIRSHPWQRVFRPGTPNEAIDLVSKTLRYTPTSRLTPLQTMAHEFFDELREPATVLPNKAALPPLFNFTEHELKCAQDEGVRNKLLPRHSGSDQTSSTSEQQ